MATLTDGNDPTDPHEEQPHVETSPSLYYLTWAMFAIVIAASAIFFSELCYWILAAATLYVALSWRTRDAKDVAGIFVLGIPAKMARVGPNFILPGLMSMPSVREYPKQFQFPQDPEYVFHGDDKLPLPIHPDGTPMVRPLRLTSGGPRVGYESLLNVQLTTKATGTMRARIRNFFDFWVRISGDTDAEKLDELKRQMNDTWFNAVKNEWVRRPIGLCNDESDEIEKEVCRKVDAAAKTRGVDSYEVTLLTPDLGHELSGKLSEIPESAAGLVAARNNADGAAYTTQKEGEAKGAADLAIQRADVDADSYRVEKMGITGLQMFAADTAARVLGPNGKLVFGASGMQELIASGTAIVNALGDANTEDEKKAA